jgi:hypothetical protein
LDVVVTKGDTPFTICRTFYTYFEEGSVKICVTFSRNPHKFFSSEADFLATTEIVEEKTGKVFLEDSIRSIPDNTHKVLHETYRIADLLRTWEDSLVSLLTKECTKLAGEPPT